MLTVKRKLNWISAKQDMDWISAKQDMGGEAIHDWVPADALDRFSPPLRNYTYDIIARPGKYTVVPEFLPASEIKPKDILAEFRTFADAEAYVLALLKFDGHVLTDKHFVQEKPRVDYFDDRRKYPKA